MRTRRGYRRRVVLLDRVRSEAVDAGFARGHPDAAAIAAAVAGIPEEAAATSESVDSAVVAAASVHGGALTNDRQVGRRGANLGSLWIRTGDFVLLLAQQERVTRAEAGAALVALHGAGRIDDAHLATFREEL